MVGVHATSGKFRRFLSRTDVRVAGIALSVIGLLYVVMVGVAAAQANSIRGTVEKLYPLAAQYSEVSFDTPRDQLFLDSERMVRDLEQAERTTQGFPWLVAQTVPVLGENFKAVSTSISVSRTLLSEVAIEGLSLVDQITAEEGLVQGGSLNTEAFDELLLFVSDSSQTLDDQVTALRDLNQSFLIPEIRSGVDKVLAVLTPLSEAVDKASAYAETSRTLLGMTDERKYLVVFQNPSEMRPLGGLPGAIALVTMKDGGFTIDRLTSASTTIYTPQGSTEFGQPTEEKKELFSEDANRIMAQAMNTPSFSEAAQRVIGHWSRSFPEKIDGVISIDPVALGYLLESFGPITTDSGLTLDESNLAQYLLHDVYNITDSNDTQDRLFAEVLEKYVGKFGEGNIDPQKFLSGFLRSTQESRLLFWSEDKDEVKLASALDMTVEVPQETSSDSELALYFMFAQGSKMYYYLNQQVNVNSVFCQPSEKQSTTVTYTLTNTLKKEEVPGLAKSIWAVSVVEPRGAILSRVMLYVPSGAQIESVASSNPGDTIRTLSDENNPVAFVETLLAPGTQAQVTVEYSFPAKSEKNISLYVTPLSHPTPTNVEYGTCVE